MSLFPIIAPSFNPAATVTQVDAAVDGTNLTTYTFSSLTLGTGKIVVCTITADNDTVNTVTVDGNSATAVASLDGSGAPPMRARIWQYNGNTSATGDIVVTHAGSVARCGIVVYLVTGAADAIHDSATQDLTASALALTMTIPANGVGIGYVYNDNSQTTTWANLTEDVDGAVEGGSIHSAASQAYDTLQTDLAITASYGSYAGGEIGVAASWGPA